MVNSHLVILKRPYLDAILSGRKQIESRFTKVRRGFFGRVFPGDTLFLKQSSGAVCAAATVLAVKKFEDLTPIKVIEIREQYDDYIGGSDEYWRSKTDSRFCLLVWLKDVRAIEPVQIGKRDWRGWVVLTRKEDFGLLNMDNVQ
ncbi:MAG: ASCH domain-containing protein [Planctomycetota bacterium]|nr:MAG: ASCH domain-containing protein [Planctomycetota bacterium]